MFNGPSQGILQISGLITAGLIIGVILTIKRVTFLKTLLLRRSRSAYNSKKFLSSKRRARLAFFLLRDRESLDILARSNLRLKHFKGAALAYRKANLLGMKLLDHDTNQFRSELGYGDLVRAFRVCNEMRGKEKKDAVERIVSSLERYNDSEKVEFIQEMNKWSDLPEEIANLLPWTPQKIDFIDDKHQYSSLDSDKLNSESYIREITRIRNSGAYQILTHITESIRSPLKIIKLPFSLSVLCVTIFLQRKGKINEYNDDRYQVSSPGKKRNSIVMFPTNGVGFGHFTRIMAVSRKIKQKYPDYEVVFFTTMPVLHIPSLEGVICYHLPGRYRYKDMEASTWNSICEELLSMIFALHRPKAFIFDGAFPYRGMLNSIKSQSGMLKVWLKRGTVKKKSKAIPAGSISHFDAVVKPGDSIDELPTEEVKHNIPIIRTNPILLENSPSFGDSNVINRFGIPKEAIVCYLQLGAGKINDIDDEMNMTLRALNEHQSVYTLVGESMIGEQISIPSDIEQERIRILKDYPNSRYFPGIDFAITAGGYNTFHEIVHYQIPSICYPNLKTGRDDQLARVSIAKEIGAMIVLKERNFQKISLAINRIKDKKVRAKMKKNIEKLEFENGSEYLSDWLINQILS